MAINRSGKLSNGLRQILKNNRKIVLIVGVSATLLLILGGGLVWRKIHGKEKEISAAPKTVELKVRQEARDGKGGEQPPQLTSFLLHPLPDELLQQLASMENLNENVADTKFIGLRVLWPVYFFDNQDAGEGMTTLLLDVSEDGFGILIESEVELSAYPAIDTLKPGQKIWIGGQIRAVDTSGTGTIFLKTEHLQFNDEQPSDPARVKAN